MPLFNAFTSHMKSTWKRLNHYKKAIRTVYALPVKWVYDLHFLIFPFFNVCMHHLFTLCKAFVVAPWLVVVYLIV